MRIALIVPAYPNLRPITTGRALALVRAGATIDIFYADRVTEGVYDSNRELDTPGIHIGAIGTTGRARQRVVDAVRLALRAPRAHAAFIATSDRGPADRARDLARVQRLVARDPDVIHIEISFLARAYWPALAATGKPVVVSLRGGDVEVKPEQFPRWGEWLAAAASRPQLHFYCVSEHVRRTAIARGVPAGRCRVIYKGVTPGPDVADAMPRGSRRTRMITVTRFQREKGVDVAIEALRLLRARGHDVTLELIGAGSDRPELEAQAARLGVGSHVRFLGQLANARVREHLASSRRDAVYVQPSRREAFPQAVLEAAAAGLPVVASQVGGMPEVVTDGETGLLHASEDPAAMADQVERLVRDPALADRLGDGGLALARRFDPDTEAAQFLEYYGTLRA